MLLDNFKLLNNSDTNKAYTNCIWTFDIVTEVDLTPHLLTAKYQQLNSFLSIGGRQDYIRTSSDVLDSFINTLDSLVFSKFEELSFLENTSEVFQTRWPITKDKFSSNLFSKTHILKDPPNYSMGKHLDNQRVVGNAIINLVDNNSTTEFFDYKNPDNVIFSTVGAKNTGLLFLNTPGSLHHIKNYNSDRYIANSSIMIGKW